jgi:acetyltransferase-like isoleucine patch superfamily enzyme
VVGSDCMFAAQVVVRTDDGHTIFDRRSHALLNTPKSVVVHSHVWLANAVRVNKGAVIGTGAVVAQGSIVGGSVEPHCIYGGVPAKKLREDVVWSRSASYDDIPLIFR